MIKQDLLVSIPDHHIMNASIIAMKQNKSLYDVILEAINIGIKQLQADVYIPPKNQERVDPNMDLSIKEVVSSAKEKLEEFEEDFSEDLSQDRELSILSDGSFEV